MKEIIRVNIASMSFGLEADAYQRLSAYLERLERYYKNDADRIEIVSDIEARIAELILSEQSIETPVSDTMVEAIVVRLGEPSQEGDTVVEDAPVQTFARRLYRSREGRRIGGVCSGLGAYFDTDPVWFRIAIFAPLIVLVVTAPMGIGWLSAQLGTLFGATFLSYFILWLVVPIAKSPRQLLEMKGEKITLSSIEKNLKSSYGDNPKSSKAADHFADLLSVVAQVLLFIIKAIVIVIGFCIAIAAVSVLIAIIMLLVGVAHIGSVEIGTLMPLGGVSFTAFMALVMTCCVLIPMLIVGVLVVKALFKTTRTKGVLSILMGIWLLVIVFTSVIAVRNIDAIRDNVKMFDDDVHTITISKSIDIERDSTNNYKITKQTITEKSDGDNQ